MPLTYMRTFRVRHYECDVYGHVNQANYLRYMQEAAFDASAAAGYDLARYEAMGRHWLVRETEIEYLHPLRYGDSVQVKTWVQDFRRVRSRRAYELRLAGSGKLAARAVSDWAFLDRITGQPAPIPPEIQSAFWPEGVPGLGPARERFPAAPPPPPGVFRQRRRVEWRDIDMAGHVNNAVYLVYVEDNGGQMAAAQGWPLARMTAAGLAIVDRRHRIEYRQAAVLDDELELSTWVSAVERTSAVRHSTITRLADGALLARVRTIHVWVDLKTGKPTPIPDPFLDDLRPSIASTEKPQA